MQFVLHTIQLPAVPNLAAVENCLPIHRVVSVDVLHNRDGSGTFLVHCVCDEGDPVDHDFRTLTVGDKISEDETVLFASSVGRYAPGLFLVCPSRQITEIHQKQRDANRLDDIDDEVLRITKKIEQ